MSKKSDFIKGWEEYQIKIKSEIEEMAQVICDMPNKCKDCCKYSCIFKDYARQLYKAFYRKVDINSVLLSREEFEVTIQEHLKLGIKMGNKLGSKDIVKNFVTAIINEILPKIMNGHSEKALELSCAITNYYLDNFNR